jgi:hypothetical protein
MSENAIVIFILSSCLIWGTIGAMVGSRRFSTSEGFWAGFFLWFFGIAIVYCSRKNVKQCPYCFSDIHNDATFCPYCTKEQPAIEDEEQH